MAAVVLKLGSAGSVNLLINQIHISNQDFKKQSPETGLTNFNSLTLFIIRIIQFEN